MSFFEFALGVYKGLGEALTTDIDVFLLGNAAVLSGARSKRLRAVGKAVAIYLVFRRADQYTTVLGTQIAKIARVMAERNTLDSHPLISLEHGSTSEHSS